MKVICGLLQVSAWYAIHRIKYIYDYGKVIEEDNGK